MSKAEREKGKRFERKIASLLREWGYDTHRSAQYCGRTGEAADVIGLPKVHIECKHQNRMSLYPWMEQAKRDSDGTGNKPIVVHKADNKEILVTMRFDDWLEMYREWEAGNELQETGSVSNAETAPKTEEATRNA